MGIGIRNDAIRSFRDLDVWKQAHAFTINIYSISKGFPREELFGLTSQIRRSASSIGANIAEGFARYYSKDKVRFYYNARASVVEAQNHLLLCRDLGFIGENESEELDEQAERIARLLNGLINSITNKDFS